jgi:SAM-dependent methyltransferase
MAWSLKNGVGPTATYDEIGRGYRTGRATDPRLADAIWAALGDARTIVNVGAGTGSYEPDDRWVLAVEPSTVMIAQRPPGAAPVVQASAEALPLADATVDAALGVLTVHHWQDLEAGLRELRRVARRRVVLVVLDTSVLPDFWLVRDYLPELAAAGEVHPEIATLERLLPGARVAPVPVPRDCTDGFMVAHWAQPHAYLDRSARAATSPWHALPDAVVDRGLAALRADLEDGTWQRRHADLVARPELDVGLRVVVAPGGV